MVADWELDDSISGSGSGSGASSIISSEASSSGDGDDDAYFDSELKTTKMTSATKNNDRSLHSEFEMEASSESAAASSSSLNRQHYLHNHVIGNDRIMHSPIPIPPSHDNDDVAGSNFEDDDLSLKDHHIIISAAASRQQHQHHQEGFGDETMEFIDIENRLNQAVPPPPPPPSHSLSSQSNNDGMDDDDVSELSDGAASLLRGPIMAARSFDQIKQDQQLQQHGSNIMDNNTPSKLRMASPIATTMDTTTTTSMNEDSVVQKNPSTTRREFISSAQKMEPWSPWSIQQQQQQQQQWQQTSTTPSAARVKFMPSAQKEQQESDFTTTTTTTPSTSRREFIHSAQRTNITQPWSPWSSQQQQQQQHLQQQEESDTPSAARLKFLPSAQKEASSSSPNHHFTPSTARSGFISSAEKASKWTLSSASSSTPSTIAKVEQRESMEESPHRDSVSSIGANSPSAYYVQPATTTQYQMKQLGHKRHHQTTPPNVTFEPSAATTTTTPSSSALDIIKRKSPVSEEAEAFIQMNKHILNNKGNSLDNIIELGERQMKKGAASASKDEEESSYHLLPAKKPFLRKGTRKEPSAVHTRGHRLNSTAVKTTTTATTPDATATTESASERKARLEQLEKMQEDLMKDLERRKMRKEVAQKERMREKKNEVVVTAESVSMKSSSGGDSPKQTPLKSRPRSVSRANNAGGGEQTPSRARQKTATKTQTFAKSAESKVKPSPRDLSVSPTSIVEGKSLHRDTSNKAKKPVNETSQTKSQVRVRARSTSRPRSSVQRSNNNNNKSDEKSSDLNAKAIEDMKKKEEEQMALIKNMRRRQEAALREAEGERERAKAWAAAEKESVKKWVEEQRAVIRKDRHKAANAALLASRRVSRGKQDEDASEEEDELKARLEEMQLEMKKMKVEAEEARKLKEQVRKQERMINALKRGDSTANNTTQIKNGDAVKRRTALGDHASKENMQQQRPKTDGNNIVVVENANKQPVVTTERPNHRPTDSENNLVDEQALPQRKPYNAADYDGGKPKIQAHSIPHFVSAPTPPAQGGRPSQIVTYQNGTTKEVLPDGTTTISFANGDRKRTYANEKKGMEVYYYAATKVSDVFVLGFVVAFCLPTS